MKINIEKWTTDRLDVEGKIRELKGIMRASGHMVTYKEQTDLEDLKHRATWLYKVRAQFRGRQHQLKEAWLKNGYDGKTTWQVQEMTMETEREQVEGWMPVYTLPDQVAAAV